MGDLLTISSEQGGLIIRTELIYKYTVYTSYTYTRTSAEEEGGLVIYQGLIMRTMHCGKLS